MLCTSMFHAEVMFRDENWTFSKVETPETSTKRLSVNQEKHCAQSATLLCLFFLSGVDISVTGISGHGFQHACSWKEPDTADT